MSKRTLQILAASLLAATVLWTLNNAKSRVSDEAKYQQWQRLNTYRTIVFVEQHLPTRLGKVLCLPALEQRYLDKDEEIRRALVTSGYLTNLYITVTNAGAPPSNQIAGRLRKAAQMSRGKWDWEGISVMRSSTVEVYLTCRPEDLHLFTRALESH